MTHARPLVASLLFALLAPVPPLPAQDVGRCSVIIAEPRPGQDVGGHVTATGTAVLPAKHHLWVFARRASYRSLELWFPQGDDQDARSGKWKVTVSIGTADDIGWDFDVTAAVFDEQQHLNLRQALRDAISANNFKPMEMPPAVCVAKTVIVRKVKV